MSLNYSQLDKKPVNNFCPFCKRRQKTFVDTLGIRHCSKCKAPVNFDLLYDEEAAKKMRLMCGCDVCKIIEKRMKI